MKTSSNTGKHSINDLMNLVKELHYLRYFPPQGGNCPDKLECFITAKRPGQLREIYKTISTFSGGFTQSNASLMVNLTQQEVKNRIKVEVFNGESPENLLNHQFTLALQFEKNLVELSTVEDFNLQVSENTETWGFDPQKFTEN